MRRHFISFDITQTKNIMCHRYKNAEKERYYDKYVLHLTTLNALFMLKENRSISLIIDMQMDRSISLGNHLTWLFVKMKKQGVMAGEGDNNIAA